MPICIIKATPTAEEVAPSAAVEAVALASKRKTNETENNMKKSEMEAAPRSVRVQRIVKTAARAVLNGGSKTWVAEEDRVLLSAREEGLTFGAIGARFSHSAARTAHSSDPAHTVSSLEAFG